MNKKIVNVNVRCLRVETEDENINLFHPVCWVQYLRIIKLMVHSKDSKDAVLQEDKTRKIKLIAIMLQLTLMMLSN